MRYQPAGQQKRPVMVHINYHPDKKERAEAAHAYFVKGDRSALERFPGGSEPGS